MELIFRSGFSIQEDASDISGRGVGMEAVRTHIEEHGGTIALDSQLGKGLTVTLSVPKMAFRARAIKASRQTERMELLRVGLNPVSRDRCRATVELGCQGQTHRGQADGAGLEQEIRGAAQATVYALVHALGTDRSTFELLDIQTVQVFGGLAAVVALSVNYQNETQDVVGFSVVKEHAAHAAVCAVLNGTNRCVQRIGLAEETGPNVAG